MKNENGMEISWCRMVVAGTFEPNPVISGIF